jgi:hypothetical protein
VSDADKALEIARVHFPMVSSRQTSSDVPLRVADARRGILGRWS